MSAHTKEELEQLLEDVVNVLDLSDSVIEKYGPLGTPPAELVRLVLEQKDRETVETHVRHALARATLALAQVTRT